MNEESSKKRLGRGLAALMGDLDQPVATPLGHAEEGAQEPARGERFVPIEKLRANRNNPRRFFSESELDDLCNSIREHGIVQPILVRPAKGTDLGGADYEIIAGERRWRAAQKAAVHEVPIIIREVGDKQALELAIIENVQRADLNAVEEALGYQQLIDEYDYTQQDLAQVIGKSRSHVANTLRLLKLPEEIQSLVSGGDLSAGHARTLVTTTNPMSLAKEIIAKGLSVRQAELIAQEPDGGKSGQGSKPAQAISAKSADIVAMEQRLEEALGLRIDLRHSDTNKGELRIRYKNLEQLEDVCRRLGSQF